jgi:hypothetical protein
VGGFLAHAAYLNCISEDAFIFFRFADNLAHGNGFVWNVGETPVEGMTSFLWTVLLAAAIWAGADVEAFAQASGMLVSLITFFVVYRSAKDLFNLQPILALATCALLALSGPFVVYATSGMETNLFALFVTTGVYFLGRWTAELRTTFLAASFFALFAATLTRPEGTMVFGIAFLFATVCALFRDPKSLRHVAAATLVYAIPFLIYFAWRYSYFGFLLPNTFYAKTGGGFGQVLRGLKYLALFTFHYILPFVPILAVALWDRERTSRTPTKTATCTAFCSLLVLVYCAYITAVGGDYMAMYRFFVPLLPVIYLLLAASISPIFGHEAAWNRKTAWGLLGFAALGTIVHSTPLEMRLFEDPALMHGTYRGVLHERWHVSRNRLIGEYFRTQQDEERDSIGLLGIGVMGYYLKEMKVRSLAGIVDPVIAHQPPTELPTTSMAGHEKQDLRRVLLAEPSFLVVDSELKSKPDSPPRFTDMLEAQVQLPDVRELLRKNYELRAVPLRDEANDEEGYLQYFERVPQSAE